MIAILAAIIRFIARALLWEVLGVFVGTSVCVAFLFWAISKLMKLPKRDSYLEIEGIPCDMPASTRYICQIRVHNNNQTKSADDVQVELLEMESSEEENKPFFKLQFPWTLLPENQTGTISINPGGEKIFTLFDAGIQESYKPTTIDDIYERVEAEKKGIKYTPPSSFLVRTFVMCSFKHPDHKKYAFFEKNRNYRLKSRITARDFPPTEIELNLNFTGDKSGCKFTLTPNQQRESQIVIKSAETAKETRAVKRAAMVEKLAQFRLELTDRAYEIHRMPSDQYHREKINDTDQKSKAIVSEILNFFQENPIELGIPALADFDSTENLIRTPIHSIYGITIYHDEWEGMQNQLRHCERNLEKIINKLEAKPL